MKVPVVGFQSRSELSAGAEPVEREDLARSARATCARRRWATRPVRSSRRSTSGGSPRRGARAAELDERDDHRDSASGERRQEESRARSVGCSPLFAAWSVARRSGRSFFIPLAGEPNKGRKFRPAYPCGEDRESRDRAPSDLHARRRAPSHSSPTSARPYAAIGTKTSSSRNALKTGAASTYRGRRPRPPSSASSAERVRPSPPDEQQAARGRPDEEERRVPLAAAEEADVRANEVDDRSGIVARDEAPRRVRRRLGVVESEREELAYRGREEQRAPVAPRRLPSRAASRGHARAVANAHQPTASTGIHVLSRVKPRIPIATTHSGSQRSRGRASRAPRRARRSRASAPSCR